MLPIAWYLLKVGICTGVMIGYYWLALRNKVFHQYNRFYLLMVIVLSILLPLVQINISQINSEATNTFKVIEAISIGHGYVNDMVIQSTTKQQSFKLELLYPVIYGCITAFLCIGMIGMLLQIRSLLKKYPVQKIADVRFVNTSNEKGTPFSFLKYIFWNKEIDMKTENGNQVFKHELAHIKEKHTYDKLFINVVLILFWCNPFFWILRKELNLIHEFIADKKAVEDSDTGSFAAMLLQTIYPKHKFAIANNFYYSPIKRRLIMLTKIKNTRANYLTRILALPLAVFVFAAFTFKVKKDTHNIFEKAINQKGIASIVADTISPGNKLPTAEQWEKAAGKNNKVLSREKTPLTTPATYSSVDAEYMHLQKLDIELSKTNPLYIVNGILSSKEELDKISTDRITDIRVLKGDLAINTYGDKGKGGVVIVNIKPETSPPYSDKMIVHGNINNIAENLYVEVDGKVYNGNSLTKFMEESKIEFFEVIVIYDKDLAINKFGNKAADGAIIATTKKMNGTPGKIKIQGEKITASENPRAAIALDKMNVLYIGIDNPVTIAVSGYKSEDLIVTMKNGSITGKNGKYIAHVSKPNTAEIIIETLVNGERKVLATQVYRVKHVPDPVNGKVMMDFDAKINAEGKMY